MSVHEIHALPHFMCVMRYSGDIDEAFLVTMTCIKQDGCFYNPGMSQKNQEYITISALSLAYCYPSLAAQCSTESPGNLFSVG